jgi:hypothetical protein
MVKNERLTESRSLPFEDLTYEIDRLRSRIHQKDDQILALMKHNKALDIKYSSHQTNYNSTCPPQNKYKNPKDYHLQKVQSGTTYSSVYVC